VCKDSFSQAAEKFLEVLSFGGLSLPGLLQGVDAVRALGTGRRAERLMGLFVLKSVNCSLAA